MCLPNWHGCTASISSLNDGCASCNIRPSKMAQILYCAPEIVSLRAYHWLLVVMSSIFTFSLLARGPEVHLFLTRVLLLGSGVKLG